MKDSYSNSIAGHDTNAEMIRKDLKKLGSLEQSERYEILADLHRDDATSDAGYFLLGDLIKVARTLHGEARLDAFYIVGRIQLEATWPTQLDH